MTGAAPRTRPRQAQPEGEDAPARRGAGVPFLRCGRGDRQPRCGRGDGQPLPEPLLKGAGHFPLPARDPAQTQGKGSRTWTEGPVTERSGTGGHAAPGRPRAALGPESLHPGRSDSTAQSPLQQQGQGRPLVPAPSRGPSPPGTPGGCSQMCAPHGAGVAQKQNPASSCCNTKVNIDVTFHRISHNYR